MNLFKATTTPRGIAIKEAIKPYSTMLQLGTQVYSNGVKKSVWYS